MPHGTATLLLRLKKIAELKAEQKAKPKDKVVPADRSLAHPWRKGLHQLRLGDRDEA